MLVNQLKKIVSKVSLPRILYVKKAVYITPNMVRITFSGPELEGIPSGRDGGNCKLTLPSIGQSQEDFLKQLNQGIKLPVRTYTVRAFRKECLELDIDFVAHGSDGPASSWAMSAKPGDFCGFRGPSPSKISRFDAEWYFVAADMSALPLAIVTLEAMPRDAKGVAVFEILSEADKQVINSPIGVDIHWFIHSSPYSPSSILEDFIRQLPWPSAQVQVCVAGESGAIKSLRHILLKDKGIKKANAYISGYWKIGLKEDEHQIFKKSSI